MPTRTLIVRRLSIATSKPFGDVLNALTATVGRPDPREFHAALVAARDRLELEQLVGKSIGASGFMEFARFDAGEVFRKESGDAAPRSLRLLVGNPLIMKEMAHAVPDAASYAPVTILVDERADGVHLSYDTMASQLAPYGSESALAVARDLDAQIETLLENAAR